jgi:hypothetical protein
MLPQDKLALGMVVFVAIFAIALLFCPRSLYERYYADLKRRRHGLVIKTLIIGIFVLALPYFYDQLVGFEDKGVSRLLSVLVGGSAYLILIDVALFAYRNLVPPARRWGRK